MYPRVNFYILVFTLVFGVVLYDSISLYLYFTYTDELLTFVLLIYWLICGNKRISTEFYIFIGIALFYLIYSLNYPNNVVPAIIKDFLIQVKPFIAFYSVKALNFRITIKHRRQICYLCIVLAIIILPFGVLYLTGNKALHLVFTHESRYATVFECLGMCYYLFSKRTNRDRWIAFAMIFASVLSLRSKAFVFTALFGTFTFFYNSIKFRNILNLRNILIFCIAILIGWIVAEEKFKYYFVEGSLHDYARPALYMGAFRILNDNPLLGTGFGSYAEFASSEYYSPLYVRYGLNHIHGLSYDYRNFIADAFFPSLAQYGYVGIFFFFLFWYYRIRSVRSIKRNDIYRVIVSLLIICFFMIESVVDSTFTHNRGIFMMLLLSICESVESKLSKYQHRLGNRLSKVDS